MAAHSIPRPHPRPHALVAAPSAAIFRTIQHRTGYSNASVGISYLEIYNEELTDLGKRHEDKKLEILDGKNGLRGVVKVI